jgi:hypothetical protein
MLYSSHIIDLTMMRRKCLGQEMLPYLSMIVEKLMFAILQDPSESVADLSEEDCENRSDVDIIEREDGSWMPVRTALVEDQALACQLLVQLIEKLQEFFYPYIEQSLAAMIPLLRSPHEDIRSSAINIIPEFIRAVAKATISSSRDVMIKLFEHCLQFLLQAVEAEADVLLIITGLQALKRSIHFACLPWQQYLHLRSFEQDSPMLTPQTSLPIISSTYLEMLASTTKVLLMQSLQRRSVLRAEAIINQGDDVSSPVDEDDQAEEEAFMQESFELHYNLAEVLSMIVLSHGEAFYPIYMNHYHQIIYELAQPHCLREDQQFGLFIICDMIEFGLPIASAASFLSLIAPLMTTILTSCPYPSSRQAAAYAIKIMAEKYYDTAIASSVASILNALALSIAAGDQDGRGSRGECTDNAVAAVGVILERISSKAPQMDYNYIWNSWIAYLPLKDDLEENRKVTRQLIRLILSNNESFLGSNGNASVSTRLISAISILLDIYQSQLSSVEIDQEIEVLMNSLRYDPRILQIGGIEVIARANAAASSLLSQKIEQIIARNAARQPI